VAAEPTSTPHWWVRGQDGAPKKHGNIGSGQPYLDPLPGKRQPAVRDGVRSQDTDRHTPGPQAMAQKALSAPQSPRSNFSNSVRSSANGGLTALSPRLGNNRLLVPGSPHGRSGSAVSGMERGPSRAGSAQNLIPEPPRSRQSPTSELHQLTPKPERPPPTHIGISGRRKKEKKPEKPKKPQIITAESSMQTVATKVYEASVQTMPEEGKFTLADMVGQLEAHEELVRRLLVHMHDATLVNKRRLLSTDVLERTLRRVDADRREKERELLEKKKEASKLRFEYLCAKDDHMQDLLAWEETERASILELQKVTFRNMQLEVKILPHREMRGRARGLNRWVERVQESLADVMDICAVMELEARGLMENCEQIALEQLHSQEQTERTMVQGHVDAKLGVQAAAEQYFSVAGLTQQYQLMRELEQQERANLYLRKDVDALAIAAEHHHEVFERVRCRDAAAERGRDAAAEQSAEDAARAVGTWGADYELLGTGKYMPEKPAAKFEHYWDEHGEQLRPAKEYGYFIHMEQCPFSDPSECPFKDKVWVKHRHRCDPLSMLNGNDIAEEEFRLNRDILEHLRAHQKPRAADRVLP